jgi:hypothetical protein
LKNRGRISANAFSIPRFCNSLVIKLYNSNSYLNNIASTKEWITSPSVSTTPTGSTIPPVAYPHPQTCDISGYIDSLFQNIATSFDILAQVVNLVHIDPPLNEEQVHFDNLVAILQNTPAYRTEPLTNLLIGVKNSQWYIESRPYRHCATHRRSIDFKVVTELEPITYQSPKITAFLLSDDPYSNMAIYNQKRDVRIFGMNLLNETLTSVDTAFNLMEAKVRAIDKVPV